jgi:hypothetical protein
MRWEKVELQVRVRRRELYGRASGYYTIGGKSAIVFIETLLPA